MRTKNRTGARSESDGITNIAEQAIEDRAESRIFNKVIALNVLAIVGTVALSAPFESVYRQFEDGGFVTYFSVIQLFIISYFACKIFKLRSQAFPRPWRSYAAIWGIISLGASFLALDDLLMIHEWLDKVIHGVGQFEETAMTDRIDDFIIGGYGLIALGALTYYRKELKKYRRALPYVIAGFILMFFMVCIDAVTNRDDVLLMIFSPETTDSIMGWIFIPEESFKVLSEAFFLLAVHRCYHITCKRSAKKAPEGVPLMD